MFPPRSLNVFIVLARYTSIQIKWETLKLYDWFLLYEKIAISQTF